MNVAQGIPERLGGDPRNNVGDAYATFMDMPRSEWLGLIMSILRGGRLEPAENEGFERALKNRRD